MIDDDHDIIRPGYKTTRQPPNGEPNRILPVDSSVQAALAHTRHELSTPVNAILGYTEMLIEEAEEQEDDNFLPDLRKIHLASQQLLTLLNDLFHPVTDDTRTQHGEIGSIGTLPTPSAAPVCTNPPTVEPAHDSEVAPGSLLVVDDNAFNRDMLSRRLIRKGYDVHTADDGYQALELLEAGTFDLVLLDVMMPGISGLEVLDILRQHYSMADLPVIMATAKDQSEDVVTALQLGANDYVTKPLDFAVVLARTQTQLALKRTREDLQQLAAQLEMRNRFIRDTFGRYVTDDVVATLLDSPDGLRLGGEKRNVTMLMADLRGFTSLAERLSPEQVVTVLNRYLSTMVEVILQYQGTIEEFIGDAIFIVFGAPIWRQDDAERAVACAVAMQLAMTTVNDQNRQEGLPEIEMGIGVHTGEVVVGNIGSHKRTKYGVVGSHANLTSRIESYTVGGQILVSEATRQELDSLLKIATQTRVEAKGIDKPITIYDVRGIDGVYQLFLPERTDALVPLSEALSLQYTVLEGKHLDRGLFTGTLVRLSSKGGEIHTAHRVATWCNLRIQLIGENREPYPGDLYAKVVGDLSEGQQGFAVHFTAIPLELATLLRTLMASNQTRNVV